MIDNIGQLKSLIDAINGTFDESSVRRLIRTALTGDPEPSIMAGVIVTELEGVYPDGNWRLDAARDVVYALGGATLGMGATMHGYTDAYAYTVIDRNATGTVLTLQRDRAILSEDFKPEFISGGFAGHVANNRAQTYRYERDPQGETVKVRLRKDGRFYAAGASRPVTLGKRYEFHDYNF